LIGGQMKPKAWLWNGKVYDYKPTTLSDKGIDPLYTIPVGWKLVPKDPTDIMVQQGLRVTELNGEKISIDSIRFVIYEAIKAAPSLDEPSINLDFSR